MDMMENRLRDLQKLIFIGETSVNEKAEVHLKQLNEHHWLLYFLKFRFALCGSHP